MAKCLKGNTYPSPADNNHLHHTMTTTGAAGTGKFQIQRVHRYGKQSNVTPTKQNCRCSPQTIRSCLDLASSKIGDHAENASFRLCVTILDSILTSWRKRMS